MSHPDTEQTYQALRRAMLRAQEAGVRIVCEAYDQYQGGKLVGCCAVVALERWNPGAFEEVGAEEQVAIERGFDGLATLPDEEPLRPWHEVGLRLRDEFRPITATGLERELGVTS